MTNMEVMTIMEAKHINIVRSRAVLAEVEHYFEHKDDVKWLPYYAEHILLLLLHIADRLLYDALPELDKAIHGLHENELARRRVTA